MERAVAEASTKCLLRCLDECNVAFGAVREGVGTGALAYADPLGTGMAIVSQMLGTIFTQHPDLEPPYEDEGHSPSAAPYDYSEPVAAIEREQARAALSAVARAGTKLTESVRLIERGCEPQETESFVRARDAARKEFLRFVAIVREVHPDLEDIAMQ